MDSKRVRATFLDFFRSKGHAIVPSAPIVNKDDPTLLFTNAGMNPFKDIFTGHRAPTDLRVADTQKCLRVSGKHNDLEEVGHDTYHHTMFEMLGNWSFGDYFRTEAIHWAWELLVDVYKIDPSRIYATVFGGDAAENLDRDTASEAIWLEHLPADHILYGSKKDNFWEMGDTGPCGPCTEIHVDLRTEEEIAALPGRQLVNESHPQVIEIWNLVLIQFNRRADGSLETLEMKSIDTGMGFERLCMVLQGKTSTYDIDLFQHLRSFLERTYGCVYGRDHMESVAMRVALDHIRAIAFTIADGQLPSNTGAGYVIRRLIRRAVRYGYRYLNIQEPFLHRLLPLLKDEYGDVFPELARQADFVAQIVEQEERNFLAKLARGTQLFDDYIQAQTAGGAEKRIDGRFAFELYDTFGFPADLTELMARELGWEFDTVGFDAAMAEQKARSKAAAAVQTGDWVELLDGVSTEFMGYDTLELATEVVKHRTVRTKKGDIFQLVLSRTPFYAESGGQVGDTGTLTQGTTTIRVIDTQKENDLIVHLVDKLPESLDGEWVAQVDADRRRNIRSNHSATHLLHAALRQVLGTHVEQRGSYVNDHYLRFDFSHFKKVEAEELAQIEAIVNAKVAAAIPRQEHRNMPIDRAKAMGAMALFGEKYGDHVRVIQFDPAFSTELCGGTHVDNTLEIRTFKITSEAAVAAGIRRIEALTADSALHWFEDKAAQLERLSALLKNPQQIEKALANLIEQNQQLAKRYEQLRQQQLTQQVHGFRTQPTGTVGDLQYVVAQVDAETADELKYLTFELIKSETRPSIAAALLGTIVDGKPQLSLIYRDDVAQKPAADAAALIRQLGKHIQGGGGGQKFYATAGGKNPDGLHAALVEGESAVKQMLGA